nr:hypothetical protein [Tanacetum cinerariifolium]
MKGSTSGTRASKETLISTNTHGQIRVLPPKTAEKILARERERKGRTSLLMAILEYHLAKFHKITDAKEMWEAIKSRFGRNDESKKMQKYLLKQKFERFSISNSKGLHKGYDRFQSLLSQLETHGAGVPTEDSNQKFLRSLPSSWSQVSLIMRTKPRVDILNFDDLYNNLKVFESDVKGFTRSSSSTHNVKFVSSDNTSSTNEVNTAYGIFTSVGHNSQNEGSSSYTDDLMYSFFANQSSGPQLDHEDLEQVDEFDLEKIDVKWQVAMISIRLKKFYKKTGRKLHFDAKARDNGKRPTKYDEHKAMVTIDGEGVDWTGHAEDEIKDYALMAFNSSNSGSGTGVTSCSKVCKESYAKLKKLYDEQREQLGVASIEIQAYPLAPKRSNDVEDSHVTDRFAKIERMHAVPPSMTGNYMPPKSDFEIDESKFTYGPKQSTTSESDAKTSYLDICDSSSSDATLPTVPKPVKYKPKVVNKPKVWSDAPIIEEYESDSDDEYVSKASVEQEKPNCTFINTVKHSKRMGLRYRFTKKACFVCGSFSHLIRDCDFYEKRMAKQIELNKQKGKSIGPRDNKPVWNKVQRLNHQNKFVPTAVLTKTGRLPVNAARQNFTTQVASTSTARKVNTARPKVNAIRPRQNVYKSHSPIRRPFHKTTSPKANFAQHKVNTARDKSVSAVGDKWETAVKASAGNKAYLIDYQDFNGGPIAFGGSKGQITGKYKIRTGKLDFEDVYFVKELQHLNLFSVSQMCDKKNKVLFTDTECLVLSPDFKLPDENQVLLRVPRQHNMYSFNLENIVSSGGLACLIAKAIADESTKWHRRVLVTKPQNKAPCELLTGKIPIISYIRPFGCHVTIFNTIDHLGKFEEKFDEEFLVGYSLSSKAFRVYNLETKRVKPNIVRKGPTWMFDLDYLTDSINYQPITAENKANKTASPKEANNSAGTQDNLDAGKSKMEADHAQEYYVLPLWSFYTSIVNNSKAKNRDKKLNEDTDSKTNKESVDQEDQAFLEELERLKRQEKEATDAAKNLRKTFAQSTKDLLLQAGAARASSTNYALKDKSWVDAMQEDLLQFKIQKVWILVDLPFGKKAIRTKWVYMNKKDERGFIDPKLPNKVYKVVKALYDLHQAPRAWYATLSIFLVQSGYIRGLINKTLFIKKDKKDIMLVQVYMDDIIFGSAKKSLCDKFEAKKDGIFISHDKYVAEILKKFDFLSVKTGSTPIKTKKPLVKDEEADDVEVTPKTLHLQAMKRIFRYLKGQPKLGLWYLRESALDLEAYSDSDYARANLDRKSTTGGCQFLGKRLILWQCKKQTIIATSTIEAEYVAAVSCCG